jgi:pimeloyl-ACP methyl ester carboxylesterase
MRRLVALVLVLALVLLGAGVATLAVLRLSDDPAPGDGSSTEPRPPAVTTPAAQGATEAPEPALERFYSQELDWTGCGGFDCATLEVPVDYDDPSGATIELAVLRAPARDPDRRVGSLVVNPGGPGVPGTDYAEAADRVFREPLLRAFDVVGFDPRGTGDSAPLDCLTDAELDRYLASDPVPDDPGEEATYARLVRDFGAGCVERSGELVGHVTTVEAARDIDVLRAALGESELAYFGASYGTKLGATYAELFPDRVGRFVLDGAVDLTLDNRQLGLEQAEGFETALRAYVDNCLATSDDCFLGDSVDEGMARIDALLDSIDDDPLPTGSGRELTVGNAFYGIVTPLYDRDYWFLLSAALKQAIGGQGDALLELADLYASRGAEGYTDNSSEAIYAINCLDDPSAVGFDDVEGEFPAFEEASPTFGRIFAWSLTGCSGMQVERSEPAPEIDGSGAAPILVVGTTRDPATPMKWAEALADQLESGVLLRRDGDGHTGYNSGNACVDEAVEAYLVEGEVPDDPTSC